MDEDLVIGVIGSSQREKAPVIINVNGVHPTFVALTLSPSPALGEGL
jgi:hypothetical protein